MKMKKVKFLNYLFRIDERNNLFTITSVVLNFIIFFNLIFTEFIYPKKLRAWYNLSESKFYPIEQANRNIEKINTKLKFLTISLTFLIIILTILLVVIFIKYYIKNEVLEIFKLSYISLISAVLSIVIEKIIKTETFSLFIILLSIIINIWKLFTDNKHKNEKLNFFEIESKKTKYKQSKNSTNEDIDYNNKKIKKDYKFKGNIVILLLISTIIVLINISGWLYFINKKNNENLTKKENTSKDNATIIEDKNKSNEKTKNISSNNGNYEVIAGYEYKKNNGKTSTFSKRSLGYEQTLIGVENQYQAYIDIKAEYCEAIKEIEKVDKRIVPGTNKPFTQATYIEVDDAYKEYLQKIAQIRQVVILAIADEDMENEAGCHYKGTYWNNANSQYKAKQFYSNEVDNYYNNYTN